MLLTLANQWVFQLDEAYLMQAAIDSREQSSRYDTMAALNPMWNSQKAKLYSAQADALEAIVKYIEANKRVTELREKEKSEMDSRMTIANLFK